MADDADLLISAGFSDAKLAAEVNKVVGKFAAAGKQAQDAFNKTAADAVENSQVVKANAREIDRLKRAYDPLYAASKRYEGQLDKLNLAHKVGAINAKQHEAALERLNAEYRSGGGAIQEAEGAARNYGGSLQQIGFQVGDFATQVGAGTSAAQALGQQLPQLLGAFGTFGALAGAGAAILIPLGAALIRAATDSASLEDRMDDLTKSTDAYVSAAEAAATPVDELRAKFGDLADEVSRVNETTAQIAGAAAKADLGSAAKTFAEQFGGFSTTKLVTEGGLFGSGTVLKEIEKTVFAVRRELDLTEEEAIAVVRALRAFQEAGAKGPDAIIRAGSDLNELLVAIAGSADEAQKKFGDLLTGDQGLSALLEQSSRQVESSVSAQERAYSRLIEAYDGDTQRLKALANERGEVEALIANKTGELSDAQIEDLKRVRDEIDKNIAKAKDAAAETDTLLQKQIRAYQSYGESRMQAGAITGGAIDTIKQFEGFSSKPYWDVNAYRAGYGSSTVTLADGSIQKITAGMMVSREDAERDLDRRILGYFEEQRRVAGPAFDTFTPDQKAALASIQHNYGSIPDRIKPALTTGDAQIIAQAIAGLAMDYTRTEKRDGTPINYNRRMKEAAAFGSTEVSGERNQETIRALREQNAERDRMRKAAEDYGKTLERNLVTSQQEAELSRERAAALQAIEAANMEGPAKAAAIAEVNGEYEKQRLIFALFEDAKRRQVDLDTVMTGSTLTYAQAIAALGDAAKQKIVVDRQQAASLDAVAQRQAFYNDLQTQMKDGLIDSIIAGESFADVLANVADMLAKAALQAALFGEGPMAQAGAGGGFFGGLMKLLSGQRALGGPVNAGGAYLVGERGPEIIVPRSAGQVIPNHQIGGGGMTYAPVFHVGGRVTPEDLQAVRMEAAQGFQQMQRSMPSRVNSINRDPLKR